MHTYLVKLTPLEKFFFGQKHKFNDDDSVNYYLRSARFPQQTALLGLLRYQYLQHAGSEIYADNKIIDWKRADTLVGPFSFNPKADNKFGQIQSLSPVFLIDTQGGEDGSIRYFPIGRRYQQSNDGASYEVLQLDKDGKCLEGYCPKSSLPQMWASAKGKPISEDDFFGEDCRVGVRAEKWKKDKEKPDEYGFFYQEFCRFKNKRCIISKDSEGKDCVQETHQCLSFAFYYTCSEKNKLPASEVVFLGGERQPFFMEVEEIKEVDNAEDAYKKGYDEVLWNLPQSPNHSIVLLLSDAKIQFEWQDVPFAITETRDFARVIVPKTDINDKSIKNISSRNSLLAQPALELYARGSLFYFEDDDKARAFEEQVLNNHNNNIFHKIGYNYTCLIPKKTN